MMSLKKPRKNIYKILDSASHMKGVLNAVNEGVITFNSKLNIVMINRHALNLWGYSRDQILGEPIVNLLSKPYSDIIKNYSKKNILSEKLNSLNKDIEIFTNQSINKINFALEKFRYNVIIAVFHDIFNFFNKISETNKNFSNLEERSALCTFSALAVTSGSV